MCALPQAPAEEWLGAWDPAHTVHQNWCPVAELHISRGRGNLHLAQKCDLLAKPYMRVCIFIEEPFLIYLPREGAFKNLYGHRIDKHWLSLQKQVIRLSGLAKIQFTLKIKKYFSDHLWAGSGGWAERRRETKLDNDWERQREEEEEGWVANVLMIHLGDVCSHEHGFILRSFQWYYVGWAFYWVQKCFEMLTHILTFLSFPLYQRLPNWSSNCTPNWESMQLCSLPFGGSP